jgi:hypothetical protein
MRRIALSILCAALSLPPAAAAQSIPGDTLGHDSVAFPRSATLPLPVVYYTPETGVGGGLALLHARRLADAPGQRPSVFSLSVGYAQEGQFNAGAGLDVYLRGNHRRVMAGASVAESPARFWGVGSGTTEAMEEEFTPRTVEGRAEFQQRVRGDVFAGVTASALRAELVEVEDGGMLDGGGVAGSEGGTHAGGGVSLTRDTRDGLFGTGAGTYLRASAERFTGDYDFSLYRMEMRGFARVGPGVVALQGVGTAGRGEVPFYVLPALGDGGSLRGYPQGRFRDRTLVSAQAEYRLPVWRRLGVVAFAGAGTVADAPRHVAASDTEAAAGWGLRYLLRRREGLSLRVDTGYGRGTQATYVALGDAF